MRSRSDSRAPRWLALAGLCALISGLGFKIGDDLEVLVDYLNARDAADFRPAGAPVRFVLPKDSVVRIQAVKTFKSGNSGFEVRVLQGPHAGETAWVLYRVRMPDGSLKPSMELYRDDPTPRPVAAPPPAHMRASLPKQAKPQPEIARNPPPARVDAPPATVKPAEAKYAMTNQDVEAVARKVAPAPAAAAPAGSQGSSGDSDIDLGGAIDCYHALMRSMGTDSEADYPKDYLAVRVPNTDTSAYLFNRRTALRFDNVSPRTPTSFVLQEFWGDSPRSFTIPESSGKDALGKGSLSALKEYLDQAVEIYSQIVLSPPVAPAPKPALVSDPPPQAITDEDRKRLSASVSPNAGDLAETAQAIADSQRTGDDDTQSSDDNQPPKVDSKLAREALGTCSQVKGAPEVRRLAQETLAKLGTSLGSGGEGGSGDAGAAAGAK